MDGGLIRWIVESLVALFKGQRSRRKPLFLQAERLLKAFQAHDVPSHQLPRLMPEAIRLRPQDVTSPETLAGHLRLEHLDWTNEILAVRRDWLDLESDQPHQVMRVYKQPEMLCRWLEGRASVRNDRFGSIHVLTEAPFEEPGVALGRFVVVYEEGFAEIDDMSLSRYWYLSEGAHFEHPPCVVDLLGIMTIAEHFSLTLFAHVVSAATLLAAESGTLGLLPPILKRSKGWRPQDWVPVRYASANCRTHAHRMLWEETREKLLTHNLGKVLTL